MFYGDVTRSIHPTFLFLFGRSGGASRNRDREMDYIKVMGFYTVQRWLRCVWSFVFA